MRRRHPRPDHGSGPPDAQGRNHGRSCSGQSFAIAGLLDNSQAQTINKYPLLGDLPILGALFRDSQFQNGQTELIIVITPYIVKPSASNWPCRRMV